MQSDHLIAQSARRFVERHKDIYERWLHWKDQAESCPEFMDLCRTVLAPSDREQRERQEGSKQ